MVTNYKTLKDHVYEYLSDQITQGNLRPKQKIDIKEICKHLQISTTPVREALAQLENEKYLERLPRRGFVVRELTVQKVKELYEIIGCLEGLACSSTARRVTKNDLIELQKMIAKMDIAIKNKKFNAYYNLQRKFHDRCNLLCDNDELCQLITSIKNRFMRRIYSLYKNESALYEELVRSNNDHKKLIELFKKGDKEEIEHYIRSVHWNPNLAKFNADRD